MEGSLGMWTNLNSSRETSPKLLSCSGFIASHSNSTYHVQKKSAFFLPSSQQLTGNSQRKNLKGKIAAKRSYVVLLLRSGSPQTIWRDRRGFYCPNTWAYTRLGKSRRATVFTCHSSVTHMCSSSYSTLLPLGVMFLSQKTFWEGIFERLSKLFLG